VRGLATAFRRVPIIRGRGRAEALLHRMAAGHGWRDTLPLDGADFEVSLDDLIGRTIYLNGTWERENTSLIHATVKPGDIVFDVGANTGYFTLLFSRLAGASGRVFAFEPVPSTRDVLLRNLAAAPWSANVQVLPLALSQSAGTVLINVAGPSNTGASHVIAAEANDYGRTAAGAVETLTITCATGDEIWLREGKPPVDLVKIDIEGHELHALKGMCAMLAGLPEIRVLVEVRDHFLRAAGGSAAELFDLMRTLGFHAYDFDGGRQSFTLNDSPHPGELVYFSRREPA
jgi:FkbM family methyltransferase